MQSYLVNWAFLLDYDKDSRNLNIKFAKQFIDDNHLEYQELLLLDYEVGNFLHRYDYRKLDYFCQIGITSVFDTLMRFTIKKSKYPLRTIAICHLNDHGMSCINFEESKLMGFRKLKRISQSKKAVKLINVSNAYDLSSDEQTKIPTIEDQLSKIMERKAESI